MLNSIAKSNFDKLEQLKKAKLSKEQIKEAHESAKQKVKNKTMEKTR